MKVPTPLQTLVPEGKKPTNWEKIFTTSHIWNLWDAEKTELREKIMLAEYISK